MVSKGKEVEKVESKLPAVAVLDDIYADAEQGFENVDSESLAIPFIYVLQKMSAMVDEDNPAYIEGAKAGMFLNTVSQQLYDGKEGVIIIPCVYKRTYIKWGSRNSANPGFKGEFTREQVAAMHETGEIVVVDGRLYAPDENGKVDPEMSDYFADTRCHYVLIKNPKTDIYEQAIVALSSTQIRASKTLLTLLANQKVQTSSGKLVTPATYANIVKMTTQAMQNAKGSWSGVKFEVLGLIEDADLYKSAKSFYGLIQDGVIEVDYSKVDATATGDTGNHEAQEAEGF